MKKETQLETISIELNKELAKKEIVNALLKTTFKGLTEDNLRKAMFEGMMRGFKFKDFLEKNIYAIPFKDKYGNQTYSLVSSIDNVRKIAMRSGLAGKSKPEFEELENGKIISCTITVKRNVDGIIGDYTAQVFFDEYDTGKNIWFTKPHTMIAKVAEMHALRSAFPEEISQQYIEEELRQETGNGLEVETYKGKLESTKSLAELRKVYASLPQQIKAELRELADELKSKYEDTKIPKSGKLAGSKNGKDNRNKTGKSD